MRTVGALPLSRALVGPFFFLLPRCRAVVWKYREYRWVSSYFTYDARSRFVARSPFGVPVPVREGTGGGRDAMGKRGARKEGPPRARGDLCTYYSRAMCRSRMDPLPEWTRVGAAV